MRYKNSLKQLGLFSFLCATLLILSCKKPEPGVGQDLLPTDDELFASATDSTEIFTSTIEHPTGRIRTDVYTNVMVGNYVDDVFGKVRTSAYMEFDLSSDLTEFPESFEIEKVVLNMVYFGREYGEKNPQYMVVNKITEALHYDSAYYSNSTLTYDPQNLVDPGYEVVNTSSELAGVTTAGSVRSLSIRLRPEFGEFLLNADSVQSSTLAQFKTYFQGLRVGSQTVDAQAINYDIRDTQTKLSVYYNIVEPDTTIRRQYDFILSDSCRHFTRIDHIKTGTPLDGISSTNDIDGSIFCYPQAGGSTGIRVNMDDVQWVRNDETNTISQAWLVMPFDSSGFEPIEAFSAHYYDENDELQVYTKNGSAVFSQLREDAGYYYIDLTSFVQDYANGYHDITELLLLPQVVTLNTQRTVIYGAQFNPDNKGQNTRLLITITN